jgi:hypothetical protein
MSAAAESVCIPTCSEFPGDVEMIYELAEGYEQDGLSSDEAMDAILDVVNANHPDTGDGVSRAELCEPCVETVTGEVYAGITPASGPDQQPLSIVDPAVTVEPALVNQSFVIVSCTIPGDPSQVATVEADLENLGGTGWEELDFVEATDAGASFVWQGSVLLPTAPASTIALRATDAIGQVTEVPTVPVEFKTTSEFDIPTVVIDADELAGTNGMLIYQGQVLTGDVEVPADTLLTVAKGEEAYLYHPDLGDVELSEETSRWAMAHFLLDFDTQGPTQAKSSFRLTKTVKAGDELTLAGVKLKINVKDNNVFWLTASNNTKRWVAVKSGDAASPWYIPPRNNRLETNVLRLLNRNAPWLKGKGISLASTKSGIKVQVGTTVEVFGAWMRSPISGLNATTQTAMEKDSELAIRLNRIDFIYIYLEVMRVVVGAVVLIECGDILVDGIGGVLEGTIIGMMTGDRDIWNQFALRATQDMGHAAIGCLVQLAATALTGPIGAGITTAGGLIVDLLNAWALFREDIMEGAFNDVIIYDAYASEPLEEEDQDEDQDEDGVPSARDLSGCWKLSLTPTDPPDAGTGTLIIQIDTAGRLERTWRVEPSIPTRTVETRRFTVPEPAIWQSVRRSMTQSVTVTADGYVEIKQTVEDNGYATDANGVCKVDTSYRTREESTIRAKIGGDPPDRLESGTFSGITSTSYPAQPELNSSWSMSGTVAGTRESACPNAAEANVLSQEERGSPCNR